MTHSLIDLFSGIGGFSLAAHSLGMDTALFCECEPYPVRVLNRHFPDVPVFPDVKELTREDVADARRDESERQRAAGGVAGAPRGTEGHAGAGVCDAASGSREDSRGGADVLTASRENVADADSGRFRERRELHGGQNRPELESPRRDDASGRDASLILTAGFPCQDLSYAGQGAGLDGERSGLYREVIRIVRMARPEYVLLENVSAILTRGVGTVLADLAESGYVGFYGCVPACAVGAPHRRDRWWAVAWQERGDERERAERMWSSVLNGLTPWGDRSWPTPTSRDHKDGGYCENVEINALLGRAVWPTMTASSNENSGTAGLGGGSGGHKKLYDNLPEDLARGLIGGSLNPAWVETLLGYPIGYTEPSGEPQMWLPDRWPAGLGAEQHDWEPPRLTTVKENRAARLKALGNSIVPSVARLFLKAIQEES